MSYGSIKKKTKRSILLCMLLYFQVCINERTVAFAYVHGMYTDYWIHARDKQEQSIESI